MDVGTRWALGFVEQYVDTRTPGLLDALKRKDYAAAADLLEFLAEHL